MRFVFLYVAIVLCTSGNGQNKPTYLALGDSYTIGESVDIAERWPVQLAKVLNLENPKIIAQTGWRTDELLNAANTIKDSTQYDLVSVLIGVNNQYQGKSILEYEQDLKRILALAVSVCKVGNQGVFMLSIPDYGATPFGLSQRSEIGTSIDEWNVVGEKVCSQMGIPFYHITDISRQCIADSSLVAKDNLHPSGKQYGLWVKRVQSRVSGLIAD